MMEKEIVLNQEGLDLYDELIKKHLSDSIEDIGDIADYVPNEIIKMLWDGDLKFEDLLTVSGNKNYIPVDKKTNLLHFFNSKGICTLSVGMDKSNSANSFADYQFFFPSLKPYCEQNKKYLEKIIFEHKINVIINQAAISMSDVDFLYDLKVIIYTP